MTQEQQVELIGLSSLQNAVITYLNGQSTMSPELRVVSEDNISKLNELLGVLIDQSIAVLEPAP